MTLVSLHVLFLFEIMAFTHFQLHFLLWLYE